MKITEKTKIRHKTKSLLIVGGEQESPSFKEMIEVEFGEVNKFEISSKEDILNLLKKIEYREKGLDVILLTSAPTSLVMSVTREVKLNNKVDFYLVDEDNGEFV